jgi:hypothetical protein
MKLFYILLLVLVFGSCEQFVMETRDITLSGKYVVSKIDVTNIGQGDGQDSLYLIGTTFTSRAPKPFDTININRFYLHIDYSTIRINLIGQDIYGRDVWEFGNSPNQIFYQILNNNTYNNGFLRFSYESEPGKISTLIFLIEEDGIESLQLKSAGTWLIGDNGQRQIMTMLLTRIGP